jgi:biopolymer transport protein ExbD
MNAYHLVPAQRSGNNAFVHKGWSDALARHLVDLAACRTPPALCDRLREEWQAELFDREGPLARLRLALGCCWAAMQIKDDGCAIGTAMATAVVGERVVMARGGRQGMSLFSQPASAAGGDPVMCEINATPLVDILLVLLITLIVSLPLMTHAVKISVPQRSSNNLTLKREIIDLGIDFDGTLEWNDTRIASLQQLEAEFRAQSHKEPQPEFRLRPNRHVKYDVVAQVLAAAQRNGVTHLGFSNTGEMGD